MWGQGAAEASGAWQVPGRGVAASAGRQPGVRGTAGAVTGRAGRSAERREQRAGWKQLSDAELSFLSKSPPTRPGLQLRLPRRLRGACPWPPPSALARALAQAVTGDRVCLCKFLHFSG